MIKGPETIHFVPIPKNLRVPIIFSLLFEWLWSIFKVITGIFKNVDVIHVVGTGYYMTPLVLAAKFFKIKIIREMVTTADTGYRRSFGGALIRLCNFCADEIIAISPSIERMARQFNKSADNINLLLNSVDTAFFKPAGLCEKNTAQQYFSSLDPDFRIKKNDIVIGMLGRIRASKGQMLLLDAISELPSNYKVLIVGPSFSNDTFAGKLQEKIRRLKLTDKVLISDVNFQHPEVFYSALDLFTFSSRCEGLGNVALEAICCGLPVVLLQGVGSNDWLAANFHNLFLTSEAPSDIAKGIMLASKAKFDESKTLASRKKLSVANNDTRLYEILSR